MPDSTLSGPAPTGVVAPAPILRRGSRRITLVVENRDHSPTETYLVIGATSV